MFSGHYSCIPPAHQASTKGDCFADNRPITVSGPQSHLFRTVTKESIFTILVSLEISCHALQGIKHFTLEGGGGGVI